MVSIVARVNVSAFALLTDCQRPRTKPPSQEQRSDARISKLLNSMLIVDKREEFRWVECLQR